MREINTQDKRFADGNGRDVLGTVVTADWLNAVQDELVGLIRGFGSEPVPGTPNQIYRLISSALGQAVSKTTFITAGNGLIGGGNLSGSRTISLGNPSTITAASTNGTTATGHSHAIDTASTTRAGIVRLNDSVTGTSQTEAATPNAVRQAYTKALEAASGLDGKLDKTGGTLTGPLTLSYNGNWAGLTINNGEADKHGFFTVSVRDIYKGGMQVRAAGGGSYNFVIQATAAGDAARDRRVDALTVSADGLHHRSYGHLHEYFARRTDLDTKLDKTGGTVAGPLRVSYGGDWAGFVADNTAAGKSTFFDGAVQGVIKGGMQIKAGADAGEYAVALHLTPAGRADQDRRVEGLLVTADGLRHHTYGWLHEYFARRTDGVPPGTVIYFAADSAPAGWLRADGAAVSRTVFADLYRAIGTRYGAGDGRTTFNLPDLRGEFIRGWDAGRGADGGRGIGTWQDFSIENITGVIPTASWAQLPSGVFARRHQGEQDGDGGGRGGWVMDFDASRVVKATHETRPRNVALLACIKI
ncbi:phage tail protein [Neisseria leonii]|uniref:phage tail protein n=1 Tax=Neisseria leonii TaxID=2995413 RepID=UPI00237BC41A|nr:phage tail protein [Neisseria sp. 3986]MDD9325603.1 tail fiber protein [Neisseria sp. 3986]